MNSSRHINIHDETERERVRRGERLIERKTKHERGRSDSQVSNILRHFSNDVDVGTDPQKIETKIENKNI